MNTTALTSALLLAAFARLAIATDGPAAASGACSHVIGPIDINGTPIGFTCEDVGGHALLVWNASQLNSNITITGGITALNFYPGTFNVDGTFTSDGPIGFIGGRITVNGSITGSSVLIAGAPSSPTELKSTLLAPTQTKLTANTTNVVFIGATGKVTATTGDVVIAGTSISQVGEVSAVNGTARLTVGTKLDIGWTDVTWLAGLKTDSAGPFIRNQGIITAKNIHLEAHREPGAFAITNRKTLDATDTITFVTGEPGARNPDGTYQPQTFGVQNNGGTITATKITISAYSPPARLGDKPGSHTFTGKPSDTAQLQSDINGTVIFRQTDNTPTGPASPVIASTRGSGAFTPTSTIVIPQLAASMSHMNATQQPVVTTLATTSTSDQVRGNGKPAVTANSKPRPKAKPVLVRGAFFGTKISATLSSR